MKRYVILLSGTLILCGVTAGDLKNDFQNLTDALRSLNRALQPTVTPPPSPNPVVPPVPPAVKKVSFNPPKPTPSVVPPSPVVPPQPTPSVPNIPGLKVPPVGPKIPKPTPTPAVKVEIPIPKYVISNINAIRGTTEPLLSLNLLKVVQPTDEQVRRGIGTMLQSIAKPQEKAQAQGMLNALSVLVDKLKAQNKVYSNTDRALILDTIKKLVHIDPLLISTAANIMRTMGVCHEDMYNSMTSLYKERIVLIEDELRRIKERGTKAGFGQALGVLANQQGGEAVTGGIGKGVRDDIDEAISYPIELQGEIEAARRIAQQKCQTSEQRQAAIEAEEFIQRVDALTEWLLALLREPQTQKILRDGGVPVDDYLRFFKVFEQSKNRVFCIMDQGGEKKYTNLFDDLTEIQTDIDDYEKNKPTFNKSKKLFVVQNIINKLKAFAGNMRETEPTCLEADIRVLYHQKGVVRASAVNYEQAWGIPQGYRRFVTLNYTLDEAFAKITRFLKQIAEQQQNLNVEKVADETLPQIRSFVDETIERIKRMESQNLFWNEPKQ